MKLLFPIFLIVLSFASLASGQTSNSDIDPYEAWIGSFRIRPIGAAAIKEADANQDLPLVMIAVVDDPAETDRSPFRMQTYGGYVVRSSGEVSSFARTSFSYKGGCCSHLSADTVNVLKQILADLPSDGHRLPPNGRRLLVQRLDQANIDARVFDLAFLPDKIVKLLQLSKSRIKAFVPSFAPTTTISDESPSDLEAFAITGDARFSVLTRGSGDLRIRRSTTIKGASQESELIPLPQNVFVPRGLSLSPDESTLIAGGYGRVVFYDTRNWSVTKFVQSPDVDRKSPNYTQHHFIGGGKYLLFEAGELGMRVFETATWNEVVKLRSIPSDALYYYDSPDSKRALFQASGKLILRNGTLLQDLFILGEDKFERASFSSDGTRVAIVTAGLEREGDQTWRVVKIRIWDANNGEMIRELRPYESESFENVDRVEWTRDGRFLLAATSSGGFFSNRSIGVWDTGTGRNVGELTGCSRKIIGMRVLSDGEKIAAGCSDNRILTWDIGASLAEIERFRKSGVLQK